MCPKKSLNNYCAETSPEKSFAVINMDRIHLDLLTILVLSVTFLWIININFENLFGPFLDIRNISYFIIFFILFPFSALVYNEIHKSARIIWVLFLIYFALVGVLQHYYHQGEAKSMFFAVWMMLTMGSIFYVGSSSVRLSLLFKMLTVFIAISVTFGLLETLFGEPFTSIRLKLIGIKVERYDMLNEPEIIQMSGLCRYIFSFAYQLTILPISSFALYNYSKTRNARWFWSLIFIISILGIFANAERSATISSFFGLFFLFGIVLKSRNWKSFSGGVLIAILLFSVVILPQKNVMHKQQFSLGKRIEESEPTELKARLFQQVAGVETILKNPLGVKHYNDYLNIAYGYPEVRAHYRGSITPPHNHFVNVGFDTGWSGLFLMILIFIYTKKSIAVFRQKARQVDDSFSWIFYGIVVSFFANLLNSCFHNTGIFWGEPAGMLMLALIGAGASMTLEQSTTLLRRADLKKQANIFYKKKNHILDLT